MLKGYVPGIKRRESHCERASACVYTIRQWYATVRRYSWKNGRWWSLTQVKDRSEIFLIELLEGKHRRILSDRVPKDRAENTNVKTATIAGANNCLICPLIGQTQTRSKCFIGGIDVEVIIDVPNATHEELTCFKIEQTSCSRFLNAFRKYQFPPETVIESELW